MKFLLPLIFALLYRNRGRAQHINDTLNRLLSWGLPVGIATAFIAHHYSLSPYLGIACGLMAFLGVSIGHAFAQSQDDRSYFEMSLIGYVRFWMIFGPLLLASLITYPPQCYYFLAASVCGLILGPASWLSYLPFVQKHTLTIHKTDWCVPGDSSWEELFQGAVYGLVFSILLMI